jgi:hypothetical protein
MTPRALLALLHEVGVTLALAGEGALQYRAPKGVVTPELRQALQHHKPALLGILQAGTAEKSLTMDNAPSAPAPHLFAVAHDGLPPCPQCGA